MGKHLFPSRSSLLLIAAICSIYMHTNAESIRDERSHRTLILQTDQATHGRPSQQTLAENSNDHPTSKEATYGLRTVPIPVKKRLRAPYDVDKTTTASTLPRLKTSRRIPSRRERNNTTESVPKVDDDDGDSMAMADAGGKGSSAEDGASDEKKTLAQQVADGKYGLIQDLLPNTVERPGVISYASNPEVPKDTAENLGGLGQEDIWLAEDHVLVLAGGGFRDKGGGIEEPWPPIDNYVAPRRQVKIPAKPSVPPPFPVQLREGEPPKFIGDHQPPFLHPSYGPGNENQGNYPPGSRPLGSGLWTTNDSLPAKIPHHQPPKLEPGISSPQAPIHPQVPGERPPHPPSNYPQYLPPPFPPQNGNFSPPAFFPPGPLTPPGNITEPFDEDDPSLYYPPPYDFYYPTDNSTEIPPGPLVPGIVLPPPPDFFSPLNDSSVEEKPIPKKEQGTTLKVARPGYTRIISHKTTVTTSTPGPVYLPVTTKRPGEEQLITRKQRPLHTKVRPTSPPKVSIQEYPNLVTPTPQIEIIPATVKTLKNTQEIQGNFEREKGRPLDTFIPNKQHGTSFRNPNQQTPLYYYNGPGISQIVITSTPKPIYVEDFYQRPREDVSSPISNKPLKNQIIYIFTSPDQQDVIANHVSSTEFPQSLRENNKYNYDYDEGREGKSQGSKFRYGDVPTPPRVENFHGNQNGYGGNSQFYDFVPSPVDTGSTRGFRFPDELPNVETATISPRPSDYYLEDINKDIQNFRQLGFGKNIEDQKPVIYYSLPSNFGRFQNGTQQGQNQGQGLWEQVYTPQNKYNYNRPTTNKPFVNYQHQDVDPNNDDVILVQPKPASYYPTPLSVNAGQKPSPTRGKEAVSIITVKPAVFYSGPSLKNNNRESDLNSKAPIVIPRPTAYYRNPAVQRGSTRYNIQTGSQPSVTIITPAPNTKNSEDTPIDVYYSNQDSLNTKTKTSPSNVQNARPLSKMPNSHLSYSNLDGSVVVQSQTENRDNKENQYPQAYFSDLSRWKPTVPENQEEGGRHFVGGSKNLQSPYYQTTPRAPKYIEITHADAQIVNNAHKKSPTAQYEEYFEANGNPSVPSKIGVFNNYDQNANGGVYIQTTTPPPTLTTIRPLHASQDTQFISHNSRIPIVQTSHLTNYGNIKNHEPGSNVYTQTSQSPSVQPIPYRAQTLNLNGHHHGTQQQIYAQTTPSPIQYHYAVNQELNVGVTTPAPDLASVFNLPSSTLSPLPLYYTTQDVSLFDDATKNYFNIFGQKIRNTPKGHSAQRFQITTPLPQLAEEIIDSVHGSVPYPTSSPVTKSPEEHTVVSLVDDVRVNFQNPLPPINPNSELISPARDQPTGPSRPSLSASLAQQSALRGGGAVVSYQLPGVDGKGVGGGSHYYFLTPQPVSSDTRPRPFQHSNGYYQQAQRPVINDFWTGFRSS